MPTRGLRCCLQWFVGGMGRLCAACLVVGRQYRWGGCAFTLRSTCTQKHSTPLLWLLRATRLCPLNAARKGGGATGATGFLRKRVFPYIYHAGSRKQGVQAVPVECPLQGCGWQWRHNMRRHCEQQHPDHELPDERTAQWDWGPEELIVLGEGEGAFWDNKRKSRWTQPERKQKHKKMRTALRDALQGDRGEEGGTVPAPPRPRVEEDDSEASTALQRGSDQGRRDLRLAEKVVWSAGSR